jgi:hypothetical protein
MPDSMVRRSSPHALAPGLLPRASLQVMGSTNVLYAEVAFFPPGITHKTTDTTLSELFQVDVQGYIEVPNESAALCTTPRRPR